MDDYGEEVYADLRSHYGVTPLDLPAREILALVRQLPPQSRTSLAIQGKEFFDWDAKTYLLADIYDVLAVLTTTTAKVNAKKPGKVPDPEPHPRPGVGKKKQKKKSNFLLSSVRGEKAKNPFEDETDVVPLVL